MRDIHWNTDIIPERFIGFQVPLFLSAGQGSPRNIDGYRHSILGDTDILAQSVQRADRQPSLQRNNQVLQFAGLDSDGTTLHDFSPTALRRHVALVFWHMAVTCQAYFKRRTDGF